MSFVIDLRALERVEPVARPTPKNPSPAAAPVLPHGEARSRTFATPAERRAYIASLDRCGRTRATG